MMRNPCAFIAFTCSAFASNVVTLATVDSAAANKPPIAPQPTIRIRGGMMLAGARGYIGESEAGDAFVVLRQCAQLVLSNVFVEIVERFVSDQLLDLEIDEIRRLLAIGAHHLGGRCDPRGLIGFECLSRIGFFL